MTTAIGCALWGITAGSLRVEGWEQRHPTFAPSAPRYWPIQPLRMSSGPTSACRQEFPPHPIEGVCDGWLAWRSPETLALSRRMQALKGSYCPSNALMAASASASVSRLAGLCVNNFFVIRAAIWRSGALGAKPIAIGDAPVRLTVQSSKVASPPFGPRASENTPIFIRETSPSISITSRPELLSPSASFVGALNVKACCDFVLYVLPENAQMATRVCPGRFRSDIPDKCPRANLV